MHYLMLWAIALLCLGFGAYCKDEVLRLTGLLSGGAIALYGLASAPTLLQMGIEVAAVVLVFPVYLRSSKRQR